MKTIVQKYGGSSLSNKEKMNVICNNITKYVDKRYRVVVVVSAQGDLTDTLTQKANNYAKNITKREMDMLLSTGEIQSASLLSLMLNDKGYKAIALNGEQAGILSDSNYQNASIKTIYSDNILNYLDEDYIVVVTGFQAVDRFGNVTTLGRGGSDLSAVAIASYLKAYRCEIYSDINGVYSSDPKVIPQAKLLKNISYNEMLEAASSGAKVLHNRSVSIAKKTSTKLYLKNSQKAAEGSVVENISSNDDLENYSIKIITKKDDISKITLVGDMVMSNKNAITKIFNIANEEEIKIYMISFSELSISLIVDQDVAESFMKKLHENLIEKDD